MEIRTNGLHIDIRPMRTADDEGWCRVWVNANANGFHGEFEAWLQLQDIKQFKSELSVMSASVGHTCKATLASAEPDIHVEFLMHPLGSITGTYALESERRNGIPTRLTGAFEADQSFLPFLQQDITDLLEQLQAPKEQTL